MGEVWPTAHITELCLQLTAGSRPVNGDQHRTLRSQSCERALLTTGTLPFYLYLMLYNRSTTSRSKWSWPHRPLTHCITRRCCCCCSLLCLIIYVIKPAFAPLCSYVSSPTDLHTIGRENYETGSV